MNKGQQREKLYWGLIALLVLALFLCALLDMWGIRLWGAPVDYTRFGSWSEAVSGIATAVAVVVALWSMILQRNADRQAVRDKEVELETAVYIWLQHKKVDHGPGKEKVTLWDTVIRNATPAPIYEWRASISNSSINLCNHQFWPLRPGDNLFNVPDLDGVDPSKTPDASILFIGRGGHSWQRTARGEVQAIEHSALQCNHGHEM